MNRSLIALSVTAALLTGCGSGPSSVSSLIPKPVASTKPVALNGKASANIVIKIPHAKSLSASSKSRKPLYISSGTQSVKIAVAGPTAYADVNMDLTISNSACQVDFLDYNLTCTLPLTNLPIGSDVFTVTTYAGTGETGAVLSTGHVTQTIADGDNTIPVALGGVIASLAFASAPVPVTIGTQSIGLSANVAAFDAAGDAISTGPNYTLYANGPIMITTDDRSGTLTGFPTSIAAATDSATFGHSGGAFNNISDGNPNNAPNIIATVQGSSPSITATTHLIVAPVTGAPDLSWQATNSSGTQFAAASGETIAPGQVPAHVQIEATSSEQLAISANTCPDSFGVAVAGSSMVLFNPTATSTSCSFLVTDVVTSLSQTVTFSD